MYKSKYLTETEIKKKVDPEPKLNFIFSSSWIRIRNTGIDNCNLKGVGHLFSGRDSLLPQAE